MIRVRINWTGLCQGFSVLHFDGDASQAQAAADAATDFILGTGIARVSAQLARVDPEVNIVDPSTGSTIGATTVTTTQYPGTLGTDALPQATAILFRWRTGSYVGGREVRGRTFMPGLGSENLAANGELDAGQQADLQLAADELVAATGFLIYSPTRGGQSPVTSASVWNEFAVMRSRRE